jgi:very-short-patch-repair endonuclease
VIRDGHCIVAEIDGSSHNGRYSNNRSRDELLKDGGIADVLRIDVEDTGDDAELRRHIERLMARLGSRRWLR